MTIQLLPGSLEIDNIPYDLELWDILGEHLKDSEGYIAYKIPILGASSHTEVPTFIISTIQHGVVLVDVTQDKIDSIEEDGRTWKTNNSLIESRDVVLEQYGDEIETRFKKSKHLYNRRKRELLVPIKKILLFRENSSAELDNIEINEFCISKILSAGNFLENLKATFDTDLWNGNTEQLGDILSLIEGTWEYRGTSPSSRLLEKPETINDFIQKSLARTFKQDAAQRQVSMQIPNGPQRIRGLAGTGKTIVLCLKAALTALRAPDFKILYLFNTQSLYNLIERQIGGYYARESKSILPQNTIDILHAWGGRTTGEGLYSKICAEYSLKPVTFREVSHLPDSLSAIFKQLNATIGNNIKPIYDMVLIDEAQDFPNEVFEIVYKLTKDPKRIVVAYDDFQSLKSIKIREFDELFGSDEKSGKPRFSEGALAGTYAGGVAKDFVLPNCYRNPRNVLMVAHGVALGVEREKGVVDSVDKKADWQALGYQVNSPVNQPVIRAGDHVEVERLDKNSTNLLEQIIQENGNQPNSLIQLESFDSDMSEINFISDKIKYLIEDQGVNPHNIFVIAINTRYSRNFLNAIRSNLNSFGIRAIMPGFVESSRHFFEKDCVVLTTPFKAKGNEADIVFVANCHTVFNDVSFRKRNSFFVSATRSRGWCYISGVGSGMDNFIEEINRIKQNIPKFKYIRPDDELIARRRLILSKSDDSVESAQAMLEKIAETNPELIEEFSQQLLFKNKDELDH